MIWIPIGAWIGAALLALIVLAFAGYEIFWKAKRLRADILRLNDAAARIALLRAGLARAQEQIATAGRQ